MPLDKSMPLSLCVLGREAYFGTSSGVGFEETMAIQRLPFHFPLSLSQFFATRGQVEPPPPSSPETRALPPRIRPQVRGTGLASLPRRKGMGKKPLPCPTPLLLWAMWSLGKGHSGSPLSLQKKRKRRVYKVPTSGNLDPESTLPRLPGECVFLTGS